MSYKQAKGAIPWKEGDELAEDVIRRLRGGCEKLEAELATAEEQSKERATKAAERIKNYQRQASLDLEAMTQLRVELHAAEEQLAEMREALEPFIRHSYLLPQGGVLLADDELTVEEVKRAYRAFSAAPKDCK